MKKFMMAMSCFVAFMFFYSSSSLVLAKHGTNHHDCPHHKDASAKDCDCPHHKDASAKGCDCPHHKDAPKTNK